MKVSQTLEQRQSLHLSQKILFAINMLAMDFSELDQLIKDEQLFNDLPLYHPSSKHQLSSPFDHAVRYKTNSSDFRSHLMAQVGEERFNRLERVIAEHLIYNANDDGLIHDYEKLRWRLAHEIQVFPEWIECVRNRLMELEPFGCCALSIKEALLCQIRLKFGLAHENYQALVTFLAHAFPGKTKELAALRRAQIRMLNPHPARAFNAYECSEYLQPELHLIKSDQRYFIELSRPSLGLRAKKHPRINHEARGRAQFLLQALYYRERSLLTVAHSIVDFQRGWFFYDEPLRPFLQKDLALITNLSESSISRLTRNKFIATSRGIFALNYFFSGTLKPHKSEEEHASSTVKDRIKSIIAGETKPLSDQKLSLKLKSEGITISRRTVAKYRDSLNLLPSAYRVALK